MNKLVLTALIALLNAAAFAAETWQAHVSADFSSFERDRVLKDNTWGVSGSYLFSPLPVEGAYPYSEADFVERVGSLSIGYARGKSEFIGGPTRNNSGYGAGLTAMQPDLPYFWTLSGGKSKLNDADATGLPASVDHYAIGGGAYLSQTLLLGAEYRQIKNKLTFAGIIPDLVVKEKETSIYTRYLGNVGTAQFFGLSAGFSRRADDRADAVNSTLFLSGRYYLNKAHGVGAGYSLNFGDNKGRVGSTYGVHYEGFLTHAFSVSASYQQFIVKDAARGADSTSWTIGAGLRF